MLMRSPFFFFFFLNICSYETFTLVAGNDQQTHGKATGTSVGRTGRSERGGCPEDVHSGKGKASKARAWLRVQGTAVSKSAEPERMGSL